MLKYLTVLICLSSLLVFAAKPNNVKIDADEVGAQVENGDAQFSGHVKITYGDVVLTSDKASVNNKTADFTATGNVVVTQASTGNVWKAPAVRGNFKKHDIHFGPYTLNSAVWHCSGMDGNSIDPHTVRSSNASASTCDLEEPHYSITAKVMDIRDDKSFRAKHVFLRFGGVPVFYLPVLWGSTDGNSTFYVKPGYSGKFGVFLQIGRNWKWGENGKSTAYVDLMSKRGVGLGTRTNYETDKRSFSFQAYGIHDLDAPTTEDDYNRRFDVVEDRYRLNGYYREQLTDQLTLRLNVDFLSDIDLLEDAFKMEYKDTQQPRSYLTLDWDGDWFDAGMEIRPRINTFYTVAEKLPELHFDTVRLGVGDSPFQYESKNKLGYYSMKWRNFDRDRWEMLGPGYDPDQYESPADYSTSRFHTQHFLYLPIDLGVLGTLTPRAGFALTYYGKTSKNRVTKNDLANMFDVDDPDLLSPGNHINNYDTDGGSRTRTVFEFGAEWKNSFSSNWMQYENKFLHIDGVRHVFEPYINYTYMSDPTVDRDYLYYFDDLDRLCEQHFIRFGIDQRWLTRREGKQDFTFLRWNSYLDLHMDEDKETGHQFGHFGNRVEFNPREDLSFFGVLTHDCDDGVIQRGEAGIRYGKPKAFNWMARYVYQNPYDDRKVYSLGSDLYDFTGDGGYLERSYSYAEALNVGVGIPLNSKTRLEVSADYDFDKSKVSAHRYILRRNLHCWDMVLGCGWSNDEFKAMIGFSLTAFPGVRMNLDI